MALLLAWLVGVPGRVPWGVPTAVAQTPPAATAPSHPSPSHAAPAKTPAKPKSKSAAPSHAKPATKPKTPVVAPKHAPPKKPVHPTAPVKEPAAKAPPAAAKPPAAPAKPAPAKPAAPAKPPVPANIGTNSGLPLPRYVSLKTGEVNMRAGPADRFPIKWTYKRRDLPMRILREFDVWRLVEDMDGEKGWMKSLTLTGRRTFVVTGAEPRTMRREAGEDADAVAILKPGVVGRIRACAAGAAWCQVEVGAYRGWMKREWFWGSDPNEEIKP